MWAVLVIAGVIALVIALRYRNQDRFPLLLFYAKGRESGFTLSQTRLLHKVAARIELADPTSLFWSIGALDRSIRGIIEEQQRLDTQDSEESIIFVSKLLEFRTRVEFNLPKYRRGLQSTRSIPVGQKVRLTYPGGAVYTSCIVENLRRHISIEYPRGRTMGPAATWREKRVNVYFWRQEDAGYYFESRVIGDYFDRRDPVLHLGHADQLVRAQKRTSVRREVGKTGSLVPLRSLEIADEEIPDREGHRCRVVDISENGVAVIVGGGMKTGFPVKLHVRLVGADVVLCGEVRAVRYRPESNTSVLHVEAIQPSGGMRNRILSFVYGILTDDVSADGGQDGGEDPRSEIADYDASLLSEDSDSTSEASQKDAE